MAKKTKASAKDKQPTKLWHGRFEQSTAASVERFVESISLDQRLAKYDIAGSLAHARMLREAGLLTAAELGKIRKGLQAIDRLIDAGKFAFEVGLEDIHMNIEAALIRRTGAAGRKLHTARSRNDQVALDLRLWARDECDAVALAVIKLQEALLAQAAGNAGAVVPAYTHLQPAQPVLLAHVLLAYIEELARDVDRLSDTRKRINVLPLGAGAVAGTTLPINRRRVAELLGFTSLARNSIDATSDRDFLIELAFDLAMIAQHLSRWAEDWILWASNEFGYLKLSDAYSTGSSMMPQKRNPDVLELIRGKTARVYGNLTALLVLVKGQPHAYNRDLQEDKPPVFDSVDTVRSCLAMAGEIVGQAKFDTVAMREAMAGGYCDATVLAEYLVERSEPFRSAHAIAGRIVAACSAAGLELADAPLGMLRKFSPRIAGDVAGYLGAENVVRRYRSFGAGGTKGVTAEIRRWKRLLA
ncbi:MAG: argininosuccinate lyase [Anaerolineaceae bacterium]|nr:argininosuccinate lyase [Anaerolineaceae bacterium]